MVIKKEPHARNLLLKGGEPKVKAQENPGKTLDIEPSLRALKAGPAPRFRVREKDSQICVTPRNVPNQIQEACYTGLWSLLEVCELMKQQQTDRASPAVAAFRVGVLVSIPRKSSSCSNPTSSTTPIRAIPKQNPDK